MYAPLRKFSPGRVRARSASSEASPHLQIISRAKIPPNGQTEDHSPHGPFASRSAITADQIKNARRFHKLPLDPHAFSNAPNLLAAASDEACTRLRQRDNVLVYLQKGASDLGSDALAQATADFIAGIVRMQTPGSLVVAGGDTASAAMQRLGPKALSSIGILGPGVALVKAHASGSLDGLAMVLKGGQMGAPEFFDDVANLAESG